MVDLLAIGQGLNALKATTDILKTMVGLRDFTKLLEKTVELNGQIAAAQSALIDAQQEQTTLIKTIDELEKEIIHLKAWEAEKQRYELRDVTGGGSFAYVVKPAMVGTEPVHCLCTRCYNKGQKSQLQIQPKIVLGRRMWVCPECKSEIMMGWWPPYGFPGSTVPAP